VPFGLNGDAVTPAPSIECSNSDGIGDAGAAPVTGVANVDDVDRDADDVVNIGTLTPGTPAPLGGALLDDCAEEPPLASLIAVKKKFVFQKEKNKTKEKNQQDDDDDDDDDDDVEKAVIQPSFEV
jgi:hypothetical protein